ncbi:chromosome segregation protein SMC [Parvibium lacunae]|uniref:Chromosome partition protein Smc n=1 Tax=Parvibium lacunae TaxID=1888893 RepID=A0A368L7D4_9BURK|nr:chromosome segregation protein SMC [Parvibium lacunae]RCS59563.1 chromosome segregation protein SMC [Parvibium lacunae]
MKLSHIKLAGFKSFVDPTHFQIPGQLVGVVGPNGCGKSNIIDAVRWVLGESKASELRGESMQDVIFNGSTSRKPGNRASVELVFDNQDGRAGGQWSQYAEIAVKRVLTRDGTSSYYINNQQVRRRDIQDIFLGTGLGPRAYAIIGQGMISRIIEARPEELRVFLEEAAGVSKYKERRRETENRLADTRENLTRVDDILRELNAQIEKLEGQAEVAQRFRQLQADGETKQQMLWYLRRQEAQSEQERLHLAIERAQTDLEGQVAALRHVEAELEHIRASQYEANETLHAAQGAVFAANAEVSKLEAEIRFVVDSRQRIQQQLATLQDQLAHWQTLQQEAEQGQALAAEEIAIAQEKLALSEEALHERQAAVPQAEQALRNALQQVNETRAASLQAEQAIALAAQTQSNTNRQLQNLALRRERLQAESNALERPDEVALEALQATQAELTAQREDLLAEFTAAESAQPLAAQARQLAFEQVQAGQQKMTQIEARLSALQQLQESVQTEGKLVPWLTKHELTQLERLWQKLHIQTGWESALEAALQERMGALPLSQLEWVKAFFNDAPPAKLTFYAPPASQPSPAAISGLTPLSHLLQVTDPALRTLLDDWLANIFTAEDAAQALQQRHTLPNGAWFVLPNGHLVGRHSVRFYAPDSEQAGLLARQQEMENLERQLRAERMLAEEAQSALTRAEAQLTAANQQLAQTRQRLEEITQRQHQGQMGLLKLMQAADNYRQRNNQLMAELDELAVQEEELRIVLQESESQFETLDLALAEQQTAYEEAQLQYEALEREVARVRDAAREAERAVQAAQFALQTAHQRVAELQRNADSAEMQLARVSESVAAGKEELLILDDEAARAGLQDALALRVTQEEALARARTALDAIIGQLREYEEKRMQAEMGQQPLRDKITELQLKEQAARLNREQYDTQLTQVMPEGEAMTLALFLAQLAEQIAPDTKPAWLQAEITRINAQINALGAVNLAALEELQTARERKDFLDAQMADLNEAITTLEDAIRKIDRESRDLLQDTFNTVNKHFGELFPTLFGGGEAKLILTGEEILDSGVQVMAQPPGKKNSTIHLLSGGEKALTATALVFALFQLNPAPFCLLDEVDAPLDDANTERYAKMVKRMSTQTQFIFISHNKIAMEMAEQLIGVTMQEQGVSRIVAVDMEAAIKFVDPIGKVAEAA